MYVSLRYIAHCQKRQNLSFKLNLGVLNNLPLQKSSFLLYTFSLHLFFTLHPYFVVIVILTSLKWSEKKNKCYTEGIHFSVFFWKGNFSLSADYFRGIQRYFDLTWSCITRVYKTKNRLSSLAWNETYIWWRFLRFRMLRAHNHGS